MKLIKTFSSILIQSVFTILVKNELVSEEHFTIFEKMFKDKSKGSFLCMSSLCVIRMAFTESDSLQVDIKPLTNIGEYPNLTAAINKSMQDIEQYLINNYSNVKSKDIEFMKDFDKVKKDFLSHKLGGFIWDHLSNIYNYLGEIQVKLQTEQLMPKNYFGKPEINDDADGINDMQDLFSDNALFDDANINKTNKSNDEDMATYKHLNEGIVTDEILTLLKNNDTATNLDLKKSLRAKGYWATQTLISDMMNEIVDESDKLYSSNNGQYNTYHLADDDDDNTDPIIGTLSSQSTGGAFLPKSNTSIPSQTKTNRAPRGSFIPPMPILQISSGTGDWKITSTSKPDIVFYSSSLTREQARFSYHKLLDVNYNDTRSTKIK